MGSKSTHLLKGIAQTAYGFLIKNIFLILNIIVSLDLLLHIHNI